MPAPDEPAPRDPNSASSRDADILRVCGIVAAAWLLWNSFYLWLAVGAQQHAGAVFASIISYVLFFALAALTLMRRLPRFYSIALLIMLGLGICVRAYAMFHYAWATITTDGLALCLYAADLFLRGVNPYGLDLASAYSIFHMPMTYNTPLIGGGVVGAVPYPALAFLIYIPALLAHVDPRWVEVAATLASIAVLYALAPPYLRGAAILLFFVDPSNLDIAIRSGQDILYVPALMLAAFCWTQLPAAAGAFFGVACAIKQEPWLDAPFFFLGVVMAAPSGQRLRYLARALATAIGAFAIPNAYFFITKPAAWTNGVFEPFIARHVPYGSGLVTLVLSGYVHWPPAVLTGLAAALFAALLFVAARFFGAVRNLVWLAPGLALFVAPRSLENYFVYLLPVCMASWFGTFPAAVSIKEKLAGAFLVRVRRWMPAANVLIMAAAMFGCGESPPIRVSIASAHDSRHVGYIDDVSVNIRNGSDAALSATYLMAYGQTQYLWRCEAGCEPVPPRATQTAHIAAPDFLAAIPAGTVAQVRVVNAQTGEEYNSNRFVALSPVLHLANPQLAISVNRGYVVPVAWQVDIPDVAAGSISYARSQTHGTIGITLMPTNDPVSPWTTRAIAQNYVPFDKPIAAAVSKTVLFKTDAQGAPTQFAGIEIYGDNDFVTFCWGDVADTQVKEAGGLYVVEPARSKSADLLIDLWKYARASGFPKGGTYRLSFVVGAIRPAAPLHATFSGFDLRGQSNTVRPEQFVGEAP